MAVKKEISMEEIEMLVETSGPKRGPKEATPVCYYCPIRLLRMKRNYGRSYLIWTSSSDGAEAGVKATGYCGARQESKIET